MFTFYLQSPALIAGLRSKTWGQNQGWRLYYFHSNSIHKKVVFNRNIYKFLRIILFVIRSTGALTAEIGLTPYC